ncbi:hypothetical protein [Flaviaesturariibacter terrae]
MIHINEFRLGNFILAGTEICPVTFLNDDPGFEGTPGIGFHSKSGAHYCECNDRKLNPVPLSDELLERLSYKFDGHFKLWQHPKTERSYHLELDRDYTALDFSHRPFAREIRYLHTLQNLYFALSGEELVLGTGALARENNTAGALK